MYVSNMWRFVKFGYLMTFFGGFLRDLRMHKLAFQNDVLPDGTELCYFARGKVVVKIRTFRLWLSFRNYVCVALSKIILY